MRHQVASKYHLHTLLRTLRSYQAHTGARKSNVEHNSHPAILICCVHKQTTSGGMISWESRCQISSESDPLRQELVPMWGKISQPRTLELIMLVLWSKKGQPKRLRTPGPDGNKHRETLLRRLAWAKDNSMPRTPRRFAYKDSLLKLLKADFYFHIYRPIYDVCGIILNMVLYGQHIVSKIMTCYWHCLKGKAVLKYFLEKYLIYS